MTYDVAALRHHFPSLDSGIAHFDGPGGTQTPAEVGRAVADTLTGPLSNKGSGIASERHALDAMAAFRQAIADLVGAEPQGVVHGRSATSLAYDFPPTCRGTGGRPTRSCSPDSTTTRTSGRGSRLRAPPARRCADRSRPRHR